MKTPVFFLFWLLLALPVAAADLPTKAVAVATTYVGVEEATGRNDGPQVERFLRYVGLAKGNPWCAAFVVFDYGAAANPAKNPLPKFARVNSLFNYCKEDPRFRVFTPEQILAGIYAPRPGDIAIWLYGSGPNPNGHTGLITGRDGRYFLTIEGNTMPSDMGNQREGGGVYARQRRPASLAGVIRVLQ